MSGCCGPYQQAVRLRERVVGGLLLLAVLVPSPPARGADSPDRTYGREVLPLLKKYCAACHSGKVVQGGVTFDKFPDLTAVMRDPEAWQDIHDQVDGATMPPEGKPQPTPAERKLLAGWINDVVLRLDCGGPIDPGRVTLRRLNREEYNNTIRDLLGVKFDAAADFPSDDVGYGFDNIGDVLSISPMLFEKYLAAAEQVSRRAIITNDADQVRVQKYPGKHLPSQGAAVAELQVGQSAEYVLSISASGDQAGPEPVRMKVSLDGRPLRTFDVRAVSGAAEAFEIKQRLKAGKHRLEAAFINDYWKPDDPDPKLRGDRNLNVEQIELRGPLGILPADLPSSHTRLISCRPSPGTAYLACARVILKSLATRAFRRPVTEDELRRLLDLVSQAEKEGQSFERGIQLAVQATLSSPQFLFRIERDDAEEAGASVRGLTGYEVATRLSYFLWSTMPDDELFRLAGSGTLLRRDVLEQQVQRMLRDPRRIALAKNFAMQWLNLRNLQHFWPSRKVFPDFKMQLRDAMQTETELFFDSIVAEDRSIFDLIDANYSFVNETLARHYELPAVKGSQFRKVVFNDAVRGGLLGQASILAVTSNATRTSPVKRGKWILENLFDDPPPPAPPGVPPLKVDQKQTAHLATGTLRQQMEQHRANPACAACHTRMDALGFGLENFDALGRYRTQEKDQPIDASGTLPGGITFRGPAELKVILKQKRPEFRRCLSVKMLTYALGRGIEFSDRCLVAKVTEEIAARQDRFSAVVLAIVQSDAFLKRRCQSAGSGTPRAQLPAAPGSFAPAVGKLNPRLNVRGSSS